jgi:hypothetical protein
MFQVARATGRSTIEVARAPYVETLWEYALLLDAEHVDTLTRQGERIDSAGLAVYAFHKPSELRQVELRFRRAAGLVRSRADVIASAQAMLGGFTAAVAAPALDTPPSTSPDTPAEA